MTGVQIPVGALISHRRHAVFARSNHGTRSMFKGNTKTRIVPPRRRLAVLIVAPPSKLSGSTRRRLAIRKIRTVVPVIQKVGFYGGEIAQ